MVGWFWSLVLLRLGWLDVEDVLLENLALRVQLKAYEQRLPKPRCGLRSRVVLVWLSRVWRAWRRVLVVVRPETVIRRHRAGFRRFWRWKSRQRTGGRPQQELEIRALVRRMARENRSWGAPRIHGELMKLRFAVSQRSVSRMMPRRPADPGSVQRWMTFLRNHREAIAAMDFFTIPTAGFKMLYGFFVLDHGRRRVLHMAVTAHPTAEWVKGRLREAFAWDAGRFRYVVCDRDAIFGKTVPRFVRKLGMKPVRTAFRSPWQNGVAERFVGTVRRECLDHVVVFNEKHAARLLREFTAYYNEDRTHLTLGKDAPDGRAVERRSAGTDRVRSVDVLGGLHHRYSWERAA